MSLSQRTKSGLFTIIAGTLMILALGLCTQSHAQEAKAREVIMESYVELEKVEKAPGILSIQIVYSIPAEYEEYVKAFEFVYYPAGTDDEDTAVYINLATDHKLYPDGNYRTKVGKIEGLVKGTQYNYLILTLYKGNWHVARPSSKNTFTIEGLK